MWHACTWRSDAVAANEGERGPRNELERCPPVFQAALAIIAVEMVLSQARPTHRTRCEILVMWSLHSALDQFEAFVLENIASKAAAVHAL